MNTEVRTGEVKAAFAVLVAVSETIREVGQVPAGILYARLMDRMDLAGFESMIRVLVNAGLIRQDGNILRWVGPAKGN